eukprot:TRINITY_DN63620_c0_g1_i1.p1 TRINITY_DN63620_c0_g1~~TRINITY_DN63620_c0_g1_i1.p1  ORF type:complete len:161 (+),score=11.99 TRINITY_DN63620_c0_g1_i1:59-484(+)
MLSKVFALAVLVATTSLVPASRVNNAKLSELMPDSSGYGSSDESFKSFSDVPSLPDHGASTFQSALSSISGGDSEASTPATRAQQEGKAASSSSSKPAEEKSDGAPAKASTSSPKSSSSRSLPFFISMSAVVCLVSLQVAL